MFFQDFGMDVVSKATLLLVLVFVIDLYLRRTASAGVRHRLWGTTFVAILLLPVLSATVPHWRIAVLPAAWVETPSQETAPSLLPALAVNTQASRAQPAAILSSQAFPRGASPLSEPLTSAEHFEPDIGMPSAIERVIEAPTSAGLSEVPWEVRWQGWIVSAWLFGCLVAILPLCLGLCRNAALGRAALRVQEEAQVGLLKDLCSQLCIRRPIALLESREAIVPMTWGVLYPVVLLPLTWRRWSTENQRIVLLHELAHVKRCDVVYQTLARLACGLLWFHPGVWYALHRLRIERELACDDCVLMAGERPSSYAHQLLHIAREYQSIGLPPAVAMAQRSGLEQRVRALLDRARPHLPVSPRTARTLLIGSIVAATLLAAVKLEAIADRPAQVSEVQEPAVKDKGQTIEISGQVVGPNDVPAAGARVVALREYQANVSWQRSYEEIAETFADSMGLYRLSVPKLSDRFSDGRNLEVQSTHVLASKPGYGPDQVEVQNLSAGSSPSQSADLKLTSASTAILGQIVDLEGQPISGIRVRVTEIKTAASPLEEWLKAAANNPATFSDNMQMGNMGSKDSAAIASFPEEHQIRAIESLALRELITDSEGKFRLTGMGDDREVTLRIDGANISSTYVTAVTRSMPAVNMPRYSDPRHRTGKTFGNQFVYSAEPAQLIQGRLTDRATGQPIAGATVRLAQYADNLMSIDSFLITTTNAQGEYSLTGVPKAPKDSRGIRLGITPPADLPYFPFDQSVPKVDGLDPIQVDVQATRGIWLEGQVTHAETGEPIRGTVAFYPDLENTHAKNHEAFDAGMHTVGYSDGSASDQTGHYRIPALPGAGAIRFVAEKPDEFVLEGPRWGGPAAKSNEWQLYHILMPGNAMTRVNAPQGVDTYQVNIQVKPAATRLVRVQDSEGQPLTGYEMTGDLPQNRPTISGRGRSSWSGVMDTSVARIVLGQEDELDRPLMFKHSARKLGLTLNLKDLQPDRAGDYVVQLQPFARIVGKLLLPEDEWQHSRIVVGYGDIEEVHGYRTTKAGTPGKLVTQKMLRSSFNQGTGQYQADGSFILDIPAGEQISAFYNWGSQPILFNKLPIAPGEVLDLGEIDVVKLSQDTVAPPNVPAKEPVGLRISAVQPSETVSKPKPQDGSASKEKPETKLNFEGSVLDPQGKPVAGAKLYFVYWSNGMLPSGELPPVGMTDRQGKFHIQADRSEHEGVDGEAWRYMKLFAAKEGFGVAGKPAAVFETTGTALAGAPSDWLNALPKLMQEKSIRLVSDDQPLEGRVMTVEGQAVEGARIRVQELWINNAESLDRWQAATLHSKANYYSLRNEVDDLVNGFQLSSLIPDVVSDANGRFVVRGIGRERIVELLIGDSSIETALVKARTRDGEIVNVPHQYGSPGASSETYFPRTFSYVAPPSVPVSGRLVDADSGEPIAGIRVAAGIQGTFMASRKAYISSHTDDDGRYRIEGLALDGTSSLYFVPSNGSHYLPQQIRPKLQDRREALTLNLAFKAAPMIKGSVVDGRTGEPILGVIQYFAPRESKQLANYGAFTYSEHHESRTDQDGNYAIAAVPGDGYLTFMALDHTKYQRANRALDTVADFSSPAPAPREAYQTVPSMLITSSFHHIRKIVVPERGELQVAFRLDSGETLQGQVVDANGKPATEVLYKGHVEPGGWMPVDNGKFEVDGYYPSTPRDLFFYQAESNSAAYVRLDGAAPALLTVQLKPAATLRGRLVDDSGLPIPEVRLRGAGIIDNNTGDPNLTVATDEDGRFEIRGIVPGRKYTVHGIDQRVVSFASQVLNDFVAEIAEVKELGDIQMKR